MSRRQRERGNAIIEFGLAFPLLFVFLIGMFQLGYGFFLYNELQALVRNGARYAAQIDFDSTSAGSTFKSNVQNMVVYGAPSGGSTPMVPNLTTSSVSVTWLADGAGIPQTITVKISTYTFSALGTTFTLTNKPQATFIYLGQFLS
ncbi:MAG: pilus assembly protein [Acidobacteria bacterium]|nr:pilus assembly protein [Acidobacteriota bacterium]